MCITLYYPSYRLIDCKAVEQSATPLYAVVLATLTFIEPINYEYLDFNVEF